MTKLSYTQFVQERIVQYNIGDPIFVRDLGYHIADAYCLQENKANAAAAVAIKRILETGAIPALRCYSKGIYFLTKHTPFGDTGINKEKLIRIKYINGNNGYETGVSIMHKIGLTSLMPTERTIVSNHAPNRTKKDELLNITVKAPKTTVTGDNYQYLQFLDILNIFDEVPVDAENPYRILGGFITEKKLDYGKLLNIAYSYYNYDTIIKLAHVASMQGARL